MSSTEILSGQDNGFISYFNQLPEKSETTVRFFNRGDFYSCYGGDAVFVAKEVFKSTSRVKTIGSGDKKTDSVGLNRNQFEALVRNLLLVQQYRVEVFVGRGSDWSLEYKGSPGNLTQFEDLIFGLDMSAGGVVMAVKAVGDSKKRTLGVATVAADDRLLSVCQFEDDEGCTGLEGLIVQLAPKEVLLPESGEYAQITKVAKRCGTMVVTRKAADFAMDDGLEGDLNRLLLWREGQAENCLALPELQQQTACSALNAAIKYLELTTNEANLHQFSLETLTPQQFVHVDSSAAKALGLLSGPGSLLSHLDRCRTGPGKRLLAQWVKQPLRDVARINDRLNLVETLASDTELRTALSEDALRRFPDLTLLARRLHKKTSNLQDCYKIYQAIERLNPLIESLKAAEQCPAVRENFILPLEDLVNDMSKFQEMIQSTLDMECVDEGEFLVKVEFSDELATLRGRMDEIKAALEKELEVCCRKLNLDPGKSLKLESNSQLGYFFRTTNKKIEGTIRNKPGFRLIDSNKSGLRFTTQESAKLNSQYSDVKTEYDSCQKSIVDEIIGIAGSYVSAILSLSHVLAKIDAITSLAVVSSNAPTPYVRPTILPPEAGLLRLKQVRHPVMETLDSIAFIPNDISLEKSETTFQIITGPNMGGKSTYIRTVGTCALLAHIGCFVPCTEAEIAVLDAILARVGAGDCQMAGVSTFMNEMVETSTILKRATCNSLVLIDELGRGTSTYEGCGLAWAIARHLALETKAFSLFATHFQELTLLPDEVPSAANFHVSAVTSEAGLTLLYQIKPGPSDRSFGIEVAKMARLPEEVIQDARDKLMDLEQQQGLGISGVNLTSEEIQHGEALVHEFLKKVKEEGSEHLPKLKEELLAKNHRYISAILA